MQHLSGVTKCLINIKDPIKTFYIKTNKDLSPNANYYIFLLVSGQIISFTNKFNKTLINDVSVYELDFFSKKITLPFCDLRPSFQEIEFIGVDYRSVDNYDIDIFEEIFYEKDEEYILNNTAKKYSVEILLHYNDSELKSFHREASKDYCGKVYGNNADNVLRIIDGMMGIGYTLHFPWGDHDPRVEIEQYIDCSNDSTNTDCKYQSCGIVTFKPRKKLIV